LKKGKVKAWCGKDVDILYMLFKDGPSHEVIEADPDIHLELDEKGEIRGIEIWNAAKSGLIRQVAKAITETSAE